MEETFKEVFRALPVDGPLEATLTEFGTRVLRVCLSDQKIRLERVVSMEADRFPELAQRFFELGPKRGHEELGRYLKEQIQRGRLVEEDSQLMAEHLISLITGGPVNWRMFGFAERVSAREQRNRLCAAVKAFLRAYSTQVEQPIAGGGSIARPETEHRRCAPEGGGSPPH